MWIRRDPEPSSLPFRHRSKHAPPTYSSSRSFWGRTNGWWNASYLPETGSISNMGHSSIQKNWNWFSGISPRSSAIFFLTKPPPS